MRNGTSLACRATVRGDERRRQGPQHRLLRTGARGNLPCKDRRSRPLELELQVARCPPRVQPDCLVAHPTCGAPPPRLPVGGAHDPGRVRRRGSGRNPRPSGGSAGRAPSGPAVEGGSGSNAEPRDVYARRSREHDPAKLFELHPQRRRSAGSAEAGGRDFHIRGHRFVWIGNWPSKATGVHATGVDSTGANAPGVTSDGGRSHARIEADATPASPHARIRRPVDSGAELSLDRDVTGETSRLRLRGAADPTAPGQHLDCPTDRGRERDRHVEGRAPEGRKSPARRPAGAEGERRYRHRTRGSAPGDH